MVVGLWSAGKGGFRGKRSDNVLMIGNRIKKQKVGLWKKVGEEFDPGNIGRLGIVAKKNR